MIIDCPLCKKTYDDIFHITSCPHSYFETSQSVKDCLRIMGYEECFCPLCIKPFSTYQQWKENEKYYQKEFWGDSGSV